MIEAQSRAIIVGGGASGVLLACHLLREATEPLQITIVERRPSVGRGVAYSTPNPHHLLNVRVQNMSAFADEPDHFSRWVAARLRKSGGLSAAELEPSSFVPLR